MQNGDALSNHDHPKQRERSEEGWKGVLLEDCKARNIIYLDKKIASPSASAKPSNACREINVGPSAIRQ